MKPESRKQKGIDYKLKDLACREVERLLTALGFTKERQAGSHERWKGVYGGQTRFVTLDCHGGQVRAKDVASIASQIGLSKREFINGINGYFEEDETAAVQETD